VVNEHHLEKEPKGKLDGQNVGVNKSKNDVSKEEIPE
jgi:hypothetical protein